MHTTLDSYTLTVHSTWQRTIVNLAVACTKSLKLNPDPCFLSYPHILWVLTFVQNLTYSTTATISHFDYYPICPLPSWIPYSPFFTQPPDWSLQNIRQVMPLFGPKLSKAFPSDLEKKVGNLTHKVLCGLAAPSLPASLCKRVKKVQKCTSATVTFSFSEK